MMTAAELMSQSEVSIRVTLLALTNQRPEVAAGPGQQPPAALIE